MQYKTAKRNRITRKLLAMSLLLATISTLAVVTNSASAVAHGPLPHGYACRNGDVCLTDWWDVMCWVGPNCANGDEVYIARRTPGNFYDYRERRWYHRTRHEYVSSRMNNDVGSAYNNGYACSGCDRVAIFAKPGYGGARLALLYRGQYTTQLKERNGSGDFVSYASSHRWV